MKTFISTIALCMMSFITSAQIDSGFIFKFKSLDTADILKADTMPPPHDKLTQKIKQLRREKRGLNVEAVIKIKLAEEQQKDTAHSKEFYQKLTQELTKGRTARLIENCLVNLYRRMFTAKEIDDLIRFYKTSAGKKMDKEFILLMMQSMKDAEQLMTMAAGKL